MLEPDRTPYDASTPLRPGRWPRWSTRSRCCGIRLDVASARAERAEADKADERQRADDLRAQIDAERGRADRAEAAITGERALTDALRDRIGATAAQLAAAGGHCIGRRGGRDDSTASRPAPTPLRTPRRCGMKTPTGRRRDWWRGSGQRRAATRGDGRCQPAQARFLALPVGGQGTRADPVSATVTPTAPRLGLG
jgi:hypothetical protein